MALFLSEPSMPRLRKKSSKGNEKTWWRRRRRKKKRGDYLRSGRCWGQNLSWKYWRRNRSEKRVEVAQIWFFCGQVSRSSFLWSYGSFLKMWSRCGRHSRATFAIIVRLFSKWGQLLMGYRDSEVLVDVFVTTLNQTGDGGLYVRLLGGWFLCRSNLHKSIHPCNWLHIHIGKCEQPNKKTKTKIGSKHKIWIWM